MADISKIKLPNGTEYDIKDSGALPLTGGTITGPVIFQDTTSMDEATIGDLVVNGNASFTNNIQTNTINEVTVGSSPKFTDTITTATTTGSGNAVTAITASNGALTVTKDTTFLTSHQDISGKADKATTLAGYGITDAKISSGTITLGSNTITPLTSSSTLNAAKLSGAIPSAVTATTQSASDNSTKIATTAFVQAAMSSAGAGTVTSVGVSNATNGGLSISGSPITSNGTITIGHSNVLSSAQTTQAVYPIKIDKNGHISEYGSAVTIPTINLTNLVDGSEEGSVRAIGAAPESGSYTMGMWAFAEGENTYAEGQASHAEGIDSAANGSFSHAEGNSTAGGSCSHAEGGGSIASGDYSHAQNNFTIAQRKSQTALGEFNVADPIGSTSTKGNYVFIVGNGTSDSARSNAFTIDWSGNVDIASGAKYKINGTALSASDVGAATSGHAHGNITNGGDITATAPTIANGDQIIINDNSASKITNGPTFDGSTTTTALTPKGTWETFLKSYTETDPTVPSWAKASTKPSYTASEVGALPDTTTIPSNTSDLNNDSGFITLSDVPDISSLIIVDTHTPTGYEFTSSQNRSITINLQSHSGYTPYALKCVCTNKTSIRIYNYYISSGTIVFEAINTTSSKVTGVNFNVQILWIKNNILGS